MRRSKPDKFGWSIQPCPFIRSNMKYRGSRRYVHEKNDACNGPEVSSGDTIVYLRYRKRIQRYRARRQTSWKMSSRLVEW